MKATIEIEEESVSNLFTALVPTGQFEKVQAAVEDFLQLGAVVKITKDGATIEQFNKPGEFLNIRRN